MHFALHIFFKLLTMVNVNYDYVNSLFRKKGHSVCTYLGSLMTSNFRVDRGVQNDPQKLDVIG